MSTYWADLAARIDLIDKQRAQVKRDYHARQQEIAAKYANKKARGSAVVRSAQHRLRLYPWTGISASDLAETRLTSTPTLLAAIVEAVVDLWSRYPYDDQLYLRRCDDPFEAETCVMATPHAQPYVPSLEAFDDVNLRNFGMSAARLMQRGVALSDLQRELEVLQDALERQRNDPAQG